MSAYELATLPPRGSVKRPVAEKVALGQVTAGVRGLLLDLERRGWELDHGAQLTRCVYRGHGIGGVDRRHGHGYVSKVIAQGAFAGRLRELGFTPARLPSPGDAYRDHRWYQIQLSSGLADFAKALHEIETLVDQAKR